jgi:hypothetical protein
MYASSPRGRFLFQLHVFVLSGVAASATEAESSGAQLAPKVILAELERAADWQLANPSEHPLTDWTQGAGSVGLMPLVGISGYAKYRDAMRTETFDDMDPVRPVDLR